jgi:hypothetical protein
MARKISPEVKVLKLARKLLSKPNGWIQGRYYDSRGGYCALGAANQAAVELDCNVYTAEMTLTRALHKTWKSEGVVAYNDSSTRRKKQILNLFDRAIKLAEKQPNV